MMLYMVYLILIALLLSIAAHFGERLCAEMKWPRRSIWFGAMILTVALPAFALFGNWNTAPSQDNTAFTLPFTLELPGVTALATTNTIATTPATRFNWPEWQSFGTALKVAWIFSSVAMLLLLLVAALRLVAIQRTAQATTINSQNVLLSDKLGPAVIGFIRPRIVLPRWLAVQDTDLRSQVLKHENQHIEAHDQRLLLLALLLVAAMPWNVVVWWQLRRLRAAIELDCDARVLRDGTDSRRYAQALFTIGQQSGHTPFVALALTEPVSDLEKRIRVLLDRVRSLGVFGFGSRAVVLTLVVAFAIAVQAPQAQQSTNTDTAEAEQSGDSPAATPTLRPDVSNRFSRAEVCLQEEDLNCADNNLEQIRQMPDLSNYELAQLHNFEAFLGFEMNNIDDAIVAYEHLLALPQAQLPDGLINSATRNLATLYLQEDRFEDGLEKFEDWMALPFIHPRAVDHYVHASILYQMERYQEGLEAVEVAIDAAESAEKAWYDLRYTLQHMSGDTEAAERSLQEINALWPDSNSSINTSPD